MGSAGGYALGMEFEHRWLGRIGYDEAHALQRALLAERAEGRGRDTLFTLEHEPVMTLGRNADPSHLLLAESDYAARGIAVRHVERGGEVTYHGPGHLVMYPIVALRENAMADRVDLVEAFFAEEYELNKIIANFCDDSYMTEWIAGIAIIDNYFSS